MVSALDSGSNGPSSSPGRGIALCSWARHFTPIVPLSTQVYKWVPANLLQMDKLWPDGPLGLYADFTFLYVYIMVMIARTNSLCKLNYRKHWRIEKSKSNPYWQKESLNEQKLPMLQVKFLRYYAVVEITQLHLPA